MTFNLPVLFFLPRLWGLMSPKVGTGVKVAVPRNHLNSHHRMYDKSINGKVKSGSQNTSIPVHLYTGVLSIPV